MGLPLLAVAILLAWGAARPSAPLTSRDWSGLLALLVCLLWYGASLAQNRKPSALANFAEISVILAASFVGRLWITGLTSASLALVQRAMIAAGAILGLYLLIEIFGDMALQRELAPPADADPRAARIALQRNDHHAVVVYLALVWPAIALLYGAFRHAVAMFITILLAILIGAAWRLDFDAGLLSFALGAPCFLLGYLLHARGLAIAWALAAALFALSPLLGLFALRLDEAAFAAMPHSWEVRARMWADIWPMILERPWFGWGFDAARDLTEPTRLVRGHEWPLIILHPHNNSMQIALETGAIGLALTIGALALNAVMAWRVGAISRLRAAATSATIGSLLAIGLTSYGVWQEWWLMTLGLAAMACALVRPAKADPHLSQKAP